MSEHLFFHYPFNKILSLSAGFLLNTREIAFNIQKIVIFFWNLKSLNFIFAGQAGVAQLVERQPSKLNVAGSNPVSRSVKTSTEMSGFFYGKESKKNTTG